ncbi:hypothetical protein WISP_64878 [Willisornis vidua]|uniref:Uncharacterized protein n=1 Tax=Willisornis vidua TaxID=1566151 RepID=A0ABQ9DEY5_9PASS|nr:hypothetical protein WISP_64878 [Willisornis vidua]
MPVIDELNHVICIDTEDVMKYWSCYGFTQVDLNLGSEEYFLPSPPDLSTETILSFIPQTLSSDLPFLANQELHLGLVTKALMGGVLCPPLAKARNWETSSRAYDLGCGAVNKLEGRDVIQKDLDRLERWSCGNLVIFSKAKCKVLHLGQDKPKHKHRLGGEWIESSSEEKNLGMLVDGKFSMSQKCALVVQKTAMP